MLFHSKKVGYEIQGRLGKKDTFPGYKVIKRTFPIAMISCHKTQVLRSPISKM